MPFREDTMGYYLFQGNYAASSIKAMINQPQDRSIQVEKLLATVGGKLHHFFFSLGESDFVILLEAPDEGAVMAVSMAVGASGGISNIKTTKLISAAEAMAAMGKAQSIKYVAPGGAAG
jgi:uncharacterized protein with GYD domain